MFYVNRSVNYFQFWFLKREQIIDCVLLCSGDYYLSSCLSWYWCMSCLSVRMSPSKYLPQDHFISKCFWHRIVILYFFYLRSIQQSLLWYCRRITQTSSLHRAYNELTTSLQLAHNEFKLQKYLQLAYYWIRVFHIFSASLQRAHDWRALVYFHFRINCRQLQQVNSCSSNCQQLQDQLSTVAATTVSSWSATVNSCRTSCQQLQQQLSTVAATTVNSCRNNC